MNNYTDEIADLSDTGTGPIRSVGQRKKSAECCDRSTARYSPYGVVESRSRSQGSEANYGTWFLLNSKVQVSNLRIL